MTEKNPPETLRDRFRVASSKTRQDITESGLSERRDALRVMQDDLNKFAASLEPLGKALAYIETRRVIIPLLEKRDAMAASGVDVTGGSRPDPELDAALIPDDGEIIDMRDDQDDIFIPDPEMRRIKRIIALAEARNTPPFLMVLYRIDDPEILKDYEKFQKTSQGFEEGESPSP